MAPNADVRGAVAELLLAHRVLIEDALYPLQEDAQVRVVHEFDFDFYAGVALRLTQKLAAVLEGFHRCILELQQHEPDFWQLRVVEYVYEVLHCQVEREVLLERSESESRTSKGSDGSQSGAEATDVSTLIEELEERQSRSASAIMETQESAAYMRAIERIVCAINDEMLRLTALVDEISSDSNQPVTASDSHFLQRFWNQLNESFHHNTMSRPSHSENGMHDDITSCSYEAINLDELYGECGSTSSGPSYEDIPSITMRLQHVNVREREAALVDLLKVPTLEIVHCGENFQALCSAVVGLFVLVDEANTDLKAKRLIYALLSHLDDALRFRDVYWVILDFVGQHVVSRHLNFDKKNVFDVSNKQAICLMDTYRLLLVMITRIPHHWIHLSQEELARLLLSTFHLLTLTPTGSENAETKLIRPVNALSLLDKNASWFKTWLLKVPNRSQLLSSLQESGLVSDVLQSLSRLSPARRLKSTNQAADIVELHTAQHALCLVSYLSEFQDGRQLLYTWQRIPAHLQPKYRQTNWVHIDRVEIICSPDENDRLHHLVSPLTLQKEDAVDDSEGTERFGEKVLSAIVLSAVAIILTSSDDQGPNRGSGDQDLGWSEVILSSISKYLFQPTPLESCLSCLLKLTEAAFKAHSESSVFQSKARIDIELVDSWFPFRRLIDSKSVQSVIVGSVWIHLQLGELELMHVRRRGLLLLTTILRSSSSISRVLPDMLVDDIVWLSGQVVQEMIVDCTAKGANKLVEKVEKQFLVALGQAMKDQGRYQASQQRSLVSDIVALHKIASSHSLSDFCCITVEILVSNSCSTLVLQDIYSYGMSESCIGHLLKKWRDGDSPERTKADILRFLAVPSISCSFFVSDTLQSTIGAITSKLLVSSSFALAVNSFPDEYPSELSEAMNDFMFLRCCLSTQYASTSLLLYETAENLLLAFIKNTLGDHDEVCTSTCDAEDLCTLAFHLATALSTSVPAALQCANLFVSANVVSLSGDTNKVKEDPVYSSCLLLAMQLQSMHEQIGGPNEKAPHLSLPEFDYSTVKRSNTFKNASTETLDRSDGTTPFVQALFEKMLMSIEGSSNRPASLDFVMLSQSTWELIHEIEGNEGQSSSLSPLEFTRIFGKLMYQLVTSKRSRLDDPESGVVDVKTPTAALEKTFPSDAQRKLMNQFYKKYCACLGLKASPTSLHRIMKHFGQCAIGTFPVTMLMILGEFCTEKETIAFLSSVWMSRSAPFLWPTAMSSISSNHDEGTALSVFSGIAVAVEYILHCEYPQVLQCIEQCHCSVLTLTLRWLSQCFWNYFDWNNIVLYLYLTILHGREFQVYIVAAVIKHLEAPMKELSAKYSTQSMTAFLDLVERPISGFRFSAWRQLFLRLRNEYHAPVMQILNSSGAKYTTNE